MSLVQFGSKNAVRILELFTTHVTANITVTVDDMTLTSLMTTRQVNDITVCLLCMDRI